MRVLVLLVPAERSLFVAAAALIENRDFTRSVPGQIPLKSS